MMYKLAFACLVAIAVAAIPERPSYAETFSATGLLVKRKGAETLNGRGRWVVDQPVGGSIEEFDFEGEANDLTVLRRMDQGVEYTLSGGKACTGRVVSGTMPTSWRWINEASYGGTVECGAGKCHVWTHETAGQELTLLVNVHTNRPERLTRVTPQMGTSVEFTFTSFTEGAAFNEELVFDKRPEDDRFVVPAVCEGSVVAGLHYNNVTKDESEPSVQINGLGANMAAVLAKAREICTCGCPYIWGGNGPCCGGGSSGYDCSGMTVRAYAMGGVTIPRTAAQQQKIGRACTGGDVAGDLHFFGNPAYHVVMSAGNGQIYECPQAGMNCRCISCASSLERSNMFITASRPAAPTPAALASSRSYAAAPSAL